LLGGTEKKHKNIQSRYPECEGITVSIDKPQSAIVRNVFKTNMRGMTGENRK
jgi:hypothetical protein